jgi:hypothetical protein
MNAPLWFAPGPNFGYKLVRIDDHPWDTLITMKEILRLEPGSLEFTGPAAAEHLAYWQHHLPDKLGTGLKPVFVLDTTPVHPHRVESEPRRPFRPWNDL